MFYKFVLWIINFIPLELLYIVNFIRYSFLYKKAIVSPKAFLFQTTLWYKTSISPEVSTYKCDIWDFTYLNWWTWSRFSSQTRTNLTNVKIWKFCSIWPCLEIPWWTHHMNKITTFPIQSNVMWRNEKNDIIHKQTIIWNDVRIWVGVVIIAWTIVWDWAVIWAWSVVTKDIPSYAVVGWTPAKIIKYRFTQDEIEILLEKKWRDRPLEKIKKNIDLFDSSNPLDIQNI